MLLIGVERMLVCAVVSMQRTTMWLTGSVVWSTLATACKDSSRTILLMRALRAWLRWETMSTWHRMLLRLCRASHEEIFKLCQSSSTIHSQQTSSALWRPRVQPWTNKLKFTRSIWVILRWRSRRKKNDWRSRTGIVKIREESKASNKLSSNVFTKLRWRTPTRVSSRGKYSSTRWRKIFRLVTELITREWLIKGRKCSVSKSSKFASKRLSNSKNTAKSWMVKRRLVVWVFMRSQVMPHKVYMDNMHASALVTSNKSLVHCTRMMGEFKKWRMLRTYSSYQIWHRFIRVVWVAKMQTTTQCLKCLDQELLECAECPISEKD